MQTDAAAAFAAAQAQYKQTFEKHLANGVNFMSDQVWIDPEVEIAPGATILPGCILRGNTKIGAGCVVGPNSLLENTELGEDSTFNASQAYDSRLGAGNKIGPLYPYPAEHRDRPGGASGRLCGDQELRSGARVPP